jgi:cobalt-zinc-cadmium efflux system outer membrane protein
MRSVVAAAALLLGPGVRTGRAQVTLADDIILAAQGKENAERARDRESPLGRTPGTASSPYRHSPGSDDILLGVSPTRRLAPLARPATPPTASRVLALPDRGPLDRRRGLAPTIERLPDATARPDDRLGSGAVAGARARAGPAPAGGAGDRPRALESPHEDRADPAPDEGDPNGLTLDAAIDRLVHCNRELRTKFLEIPQAEADVLTAGLRENPLFFYSSDGVPYGSYSPRRPGEIDHGISLVFPVDYTGKRRARVATASEEKRVLEAQYRDAVRLAIDDLYTAYVDALAARQAVHAAGRGLEAVEQMLRDAQARPPRAEADDEAIDDLIIERDLAAIADDDARERYQRARHRLGGLLDLDPQEAEALELGGSLRIADDGLPDRRELVLVALRHRPDLAAYRIGIDRSRAALRRERAERFSDAYLLYTPFEYRDNSPVGLQSASSWGAGLFVSLPLFNRNQGNLARARINLEQSRNEAAAREREVVAEVLQAAHDFEDSLSDARRLERITLPAVRRKRDRARARAARGEVAPAAYLDVRRDTTAIVRYHRETLARHRRNALRINTVLGLRLLP